MRYEVWGMRYELRTAGQFIFLKDEIRLLAFY